MNRVLIVIDAQEDFTRKALRNEDAINALPVIKDIVAYADNHNVSIIYTADTHEKDYLSTQEGKNLPVEHCIYGTTGWKLCPEVKSIKNEYIICKQSFGSIDWNSWRASKILANADEIWLCGFCTDICVSANFQTIKATYPEIPIVVVKDACAGVTPELHEAALKVMKSCQARVVKWEDLKKENINEA